MPHRSIDVLSLLDLEPSILTNLENVITLAKATKADLPPDAETIVQGVQAIINLAQSLPLSYDECAELLVELTFRFKPGGQDAPIVRALAALPDAFVVGVNSSFDGNSCVSALTSVP